MSGVMFTQRFILLFFFQYCIVHLNAQEWLWAIHAGGSTVDDAYSIATDQQGNIYLTGYFGSDGISFDNVTLTSKGNIDVFVAKYNADGEIQWAKSAGGAGNDYGYSIAVDPTGNICVAGTFENDSIHFGALALENIGGFDAFIAKYDALGNLLWAKSAGGAEADEAYGITTDSDANIYITGQFTSQSVSFDQTSIQNSNSGFQEIYVAKFDAGGNLQWAKTAAGAHNDIAYSIVSSPTGDLYITGFYRSLSIGFSQILLLNTAPAREMFVTKYNTEGEVLWAKKAGGEQNDLGYSVQMVSDEILQVSGSFRSDSIIFGNTVIKNTQPGMLDFFITRYDTSGQAIWARGGGGLYDDHGFCNTTDPASEAFIAGGYLSESIILGSDTLMNTGDSTYEMFIVKYEPNGNPLWTESIGGSGDDYINWITCDPSGNLLVVGYFGSPSVTFGTTTLLNNNGDLFIAKLSPAMVDVQDLETNPEHFLVYPNPVHQSVTIEWKENDNPVDVKIYTPLGEIVFNQKLYGSLTLNRDSDLRRPAGVYFISILNGRKRYVQKLVLQ